MKNRYDHRWDGFGRRVDPEDVTDAYIAQKYILCDLHTYGGNESDEILEAFVCASWFRQIKTDMRLSHCKPPTVEAAPKEKYGGPTYTLEQQIRNERRED